MHSSSSVSDISTIAVVANRCLALSLLPTDRLTVSQIVYAGAGNAMAVGSTTSSILGYVIDTGVDLRSTGLQVASFSRVPSALHKFCLSCGGYDTRGRWYSFDRVTVKSATGCVPAASKLGRKEHPTRSGTRRSDYATTIWRSLQDKRCLEGI